MTRTVFLGSPEIALPSLRALAEASAQSSARASAPSTREQPHVNLVGVVAQPARPVGRKRRMQPCPVQAEAEALGLPVFTPEKVRDPAALERLRAWEPELMIVCAYGQLFPEALLDMPPLGCFNLHFSLLPRWRGASPVQAALLSGDAVTGVSLQKMVLELDAGAIAADSGALTIAPEDTAGSLGGRLGVAAAELLMKTLPLLAGGDPPLHPQSLEGITHCRTIKKGQGAVDFAAETAVDIERKCRAYTPWPGAFAYLDARRIGLNRVTLAQPPEVQPAVAQPPDAQHPEAQHPEAQPRKDSPANPGQLRADGLVACREGWLRIETLTPEGKAAMDFRAFLNGNPAAVGKTFLPGPGTS